MEGSAEVVERGSIREVLIAFLKLGLTSFGGPIAHIGYFRNEFVVRRRWIDETGYADLVALCQFLPGPASSQVGFAIGLARAGPLGAAAAWMGFTLPSALLMVAFAYGAGALLTGPIGVAILHGLKLVAVAVVAQAVIGMIRTLTPDLTRAAIALGALAAVILVAGALGQVAAIAGGGIVGFWMCRNSPVRPAGQPRLGVPRTVAIVCLVLFGVLLVALPLLRAATGFQFIAVIDAFYRSGALVFGGGHVVLPLLQAETVSPGWMSNSAFLAGYGAAQAVPGPLFAFAAYLGAVLISEPNGLAGAIIALLAIFLPGLLILVAALPFWNALRSKPSIQAALRGTNAAVVGILAAALYDAVWKSAVFTPLDFVIAAAGIAALVVSRCQPWIVMVGIVSIAAGLALLSQNVKL